MSAQPLFENGDLAVYEALDLETGKWAIYPGTAGDDVAGEAPPLRTGYAEYPEEYCTWLGPDERDFAEARDRCWIYHASRLIPGDLDVIIKEQFGAADVQVEPNGSIWVANRRAGLRGQWLTPEALKQVADRLRAEQKVRAWLYH